MTKEQLRAIMQAKNASRDHSVPEWNEAFNQYNAANPTRQLKKGSCGSCFRSVWDWLMK